MKLSEVVPFSSIEAQLGQELRVRGYDTSKVKEMVDLVPGDVFGIGAYFWHRIVVEGKHRVDPQQMSRYFQNGSPAIISAIGRVLGSPAIKDFGYSFAVSRDGFGVATSTVAHLQNNELHFYDVALSDPRRPLVAGGPGSELRGHHGFGMLSAVVERLRTAARERGCHAISLTAATGELVPVFKRHGFEVEDTEFARAAQTGLAVNIPMRTLVDP